MGIINIIRGLIRRYPKLDSYLLINRRKLMPLIKGFPEWDKVISLPDFNLQNKQTNLQQKKILIATSIGSHLPAIHMESLLAASLVIRGVEVETLLCDGILPACQMCEPRFFSSVESLVTHGPTKNLCGSCFKPGHKVYKDLGLKTHSYTDSITKKELELADKLSSEIKITDLECFEFDGLKLGEHAKAGALRFFAKATISDEPYAEKVLRIYLKAALITAFTINRLLSTGGFDVVVFHHGIYVPQGIIGEVARKLGIRVVNWNPAYRKNCFIFSHNDTYHHTLMHEPVISWEAMSWTSDKEAKIKSYLHSRWFGNNDWIHFHDNPYFDKNKILSEIGCDINRPIIGCLTNVMWDAQLHYPANAFATMIDWLFYTIKYFAVRADLQLVIRVHPAEIRGAVPSRQPVVDELFKLFDKLPSNVFLIPPESNISTYALSELCNSVIIYGTKTGVELTSMSIPVVVAGEAWIRNKGITFDASSPESYSRILDKLPFKTKLDKKTTTRALKYAYHFFFRRMIPVNILNAKKGWPPYVFEGVLEDTYPGSDKGLDVICEGIINGTPFIFDN